MLDNNFSWIFAPIWKSHFQKWSIFLEWPDTGKKISDFTCSRHKIIRESKNKIVFDFIYEKYHKCGELPAPRF